MKKRLLALVLSLFLMTSCANQPSLSDDAGNNTGSAASESVTPSLNSGAGMATASLDSAKETTAYEEATAPQASENTQGEPTPEDIRKLYPDKTVLSISCNTYIYRRDMVVKANEYLSSIGKEYVICICSVEAEYVKIGNSDNMGRYDYNSAIEKMADKVDIVLSTDYSDTVEKGILLPLNEYIEGSKLPYASRPRILFPLIMPRTTATFPESQTL